jgi:hypothetical protein
MIKDLEAKLDKNGDSQAKSESGDLQKDKLVKDMED